MSRDRVRRSLVRVFIVHMRCLMCKSGNMEATGDTRTNDDEALMYTHKCDLCGYYEYLAITYPYKEVIQIDAENQAEPITPNTIDRLGL